MSKNSYKKILLIGPPNVGKSVFFNYFTKMNVAVSNYIGTTVDYTQGTFNLNNEFYTLIDVPGIYSLNATNKAEEIAVEMLSQNPSAVICVLDAKNIESSIYLLMQILQQNIPLIAVINRNDIIEEKGLFIDDIYLSKVFNINVIKTVAVTGKGIDKLKNDLQHLLLNSENQTIKLDLSDDELWKKAEEISKKIVKGKKSNKKLNREKWGELLVQPYPGLPLSIIIMGIVFGIVVGFGMSLRRFILLPFFRNLIFPYIIMLIENITQEGMLRNILIGNYGFLIKGLEWPFALVFPYIISFYIALSLLEDSGYLPRFGVLIDGLLNKIGLTGGSVIPFLLGYGCAIPGITATRSLSSNKERIIVSTAICFAIPCIAQTGAIISLLSERSILIVFLLFVVSIFFLILLSVIMNYFYKTDCLYNVVEIPELLFPKLNVISKKVWIRMKNFLVKGELPMIYTIGFAAVLYESGALIYIGNLLKPIVMNWLMLPVEASIPLILGIIRRELTVLPLLEMELTLLQLFVASLVGLFYVPCIAVIAILNSEFGFKVALGVFVMTTSISFLLGGTIARLGSLLF